MFKIIEDQTIRTKVKFSIPTDEKDPDKTAFIFVTYKIVPQSKKREREDEQTASLHKLRNYISGSEESFRTRVPKNGSAEAGDDDDQEEIQEESLETIDLDDRNLIEDIINIEGVVLPEEEEPAEFSRKVLDFCLDISYVRAAMLEKWNRVQNDTAFLKDATRKN